MSSGGTENSWSLNREHGRQEEHGQAARRRCLGRTMADPGRADQPGAPWASFRANGGLYHPERQRASPGTARPLTPPTGVRPPWGHSLWLHKDRDVARVTAGHNQALPRHDNLPDSFAKSKRLAEGGKAKPGQSRDKVVINTVDHGTRHRVYAPRRSPLTAGQRNKWSEPWGAHVGLKSDDARPYSSALLTNTVAMDAQNPVVYCAVTVVYLAPYPGRAFVNRSKAMNNESYSKRHFFSED